MGPIWGRQDPGGPHVGPMNIASWACSLKQSVFDRAREIGNLLLSLLLAGSSSQSDNTLRTLILILNIYLQQKDDISQ